MYEEFLTIEENTKDWSVRNEKKGNTEVRITNKAEDSSDKSFQVQWKDSNFHLFEFVFLIQRGRYSTKTIK